MKKGSKRGEGVLDFSTFSYPCHVLCGLCIPTPTPAFIGRKPYGGPSPPHRGVTVLTRDGRSRKATHCLNDPLNLTFSLLSHPYLSGRFLDGRITLAYFPPPSGNLRSEKSASNNTSTRNHPSEMSWAKTRGITWSTASRQN
jgi:hypothetical protein